MEGLDITRSNICRKVGAVRKRGMIIIRGKRREMVKPNSWKLSLHVRDRLSLLLLLCIYTHTHIRTLLQFLISEKSLSPERRGRPSPVETEVSRRRGKPIYSECNILHIYIFFFHTRAFSKIRRLPRIFESHLKIGLIPMVGRTREISERNKRFGLFLRKEIFVRRDELQVGSKVSDRDEINFLPFGEF